MNIRRKLVIAFGATALTFAVSTGTLAQTNVSNEIAPTGKLRVGMHAANANLVTRAPDGSVSGLAIDMGKFFAAKLGVPFEPVVYPSNASFVASFGKGDWDTTIAGRNSFAETLLDYMPVVIQVEYVFVAAPGIGIADAGEVDKTGIRIGVAGNATGDVVLSGKLKSAALVRVAGDVAAAVDLLRTGKADMFATSTEVALIIAERVPGARILAGTFTTVDFAVAMPKGRTSAAQEKITQLVNEAKTAGVVQKAIETSNLKGVRAAPK
jgi:polar amino acid transport system substrate-binding protein